MNTEDTEFGKLVKDHLYTHEQVSEQRAELEQIGENLVLLGNNLKEHPQNIHIGEAKITLQDDRHGDRIIRLSTMNIADILHTVEELKQATEREQQLAGRIREAGMGHIVDGLENRRLQTRDIPGESE